MSVTWPKKNDRDCTCPAVHPDTRKQRSAICCPEQAVVLYTSFYACAITDIASAQHRNLHGYVGACHDAEKNGLDMYGTKTVFLSVFFFFFSIVMSSAPGTRHINFIHHLVLFPPFKP